jgi:cytoskeletal protein RodZ
MRANPKLLVVASMTLWMMTAWAQQTRPPTAPHDAVMQGQQPTTVPETRSEQRKTDHDRSPIFDAAQAPAASPVFQTQDKQGVDGIRLLS